MDKEKQTKFYFKITGENYQKILEVNGNKALIHDLYKRHPLYDSLLGTPGIENMGKIENPREFMKKIEKIETPLTPDSIGNFLEENISLTEAGKTYIQYGFNGKRGAIEMNLKMDEDKLNYFQTKRETLDHLSYVICHIKDFLKGRNPETEYREIRQLRIAILERSIKRFKSELLEVPEESIEYEIKRIENLKAEILITTESMRGLPIPNVYLEDQRNIYKH